MVRFFLLGNIYIVFSKSQKQYESKHVTLIAAFGAVDEPLASSMIVHFSAHNLK